MFIQVFMHISVYILCVYIMFEFMHLHSVHEFIKSLFSFRGPNLSKDRSSSKFSPSNNYHNKQVRIKHNHVAKQSQFICMFHCFLVFNKKNRNLCQVCVRIFKLKILYKHRLSFFILYNQTKHFTGSTI